MKKSFIKIQIILSERHLITIPVCMVATGQMALHVGPFIELATRALKTTIYSNFRVCRASGPEIWTEI